jgi:hypothetical protein
MLFLLCRGLPARPLLRGGHTAPAGSLKKPPACGIIQLTKTKFPARRGIMTNEKIVRTILKAISAIEDKLDDSALDKIGKELEAIEDAIKELSIA